MTDQLTPAEAELAAAIAARMARDAAIEAQPHLPWPCGYHWDSHTCIELIQGPPTGHTHRCCCNATECTPGEETR